MRPLTASNNSRIISDMIDIVEAKKQGFGGDGGRQHVVKDQNIQPTRQKSASVQNAFWRQANSRRNDHTVGRRRQRRSGIHPRWCQVYAVGPKQADVTVGQWLMVAHGRWSRALKVEKDGIAEEVRMIDENDILLVSDEEPSDADVAPKAGYINTGSHTDDTYAW
jgi:hypothetical protein